MIGLFLIALAVPFAAFASWFNRLARMEPHERELVKVGQGVSMIAITGYITIYLYGWDAFMQQVRLATLDLSNPYMYTPLGVCAVVAWGIFWIMGYHRLIGAFDIRLAAKAAFFLVLGIFLLYQATHYTRLWHDWDGPYSRVLVAGAGIWMIVGAIVRGTVLSTGLEMSSPKRRSLEEALDDDNNGPWGGSRVVKSEEARDRLGRR